MGLAKSTTPKEKLKTPANKWLSLNAEPTFSLVKSKNSVMLLNKLNAAVNLPRLNLMNPTNVQTSSTLKTQLLSTKNVRLKQNFNKPNPKSKSPFLKDVTLKKKPRNPSLMRL